MTSIQKNNTELNLIRNSEYFDYYSSENGQYDDVMNILDGKCEELMREFNIEPECRIRIEIYPDIETYHDNMWEGLVPGVDFTCSDQIIGNTDESSDTIRIVSPHNPGPVHTYKTAVKTVLHEFIHVLTMMKFKAENPVHTKESFGKVKWMHEAIAVYRSEQYKDFLHYFLKKINKKVPSFNDLDDLQLRYVAAWSFAQFMEEEFTISQLLELMVREDMSEDVTGLQEHELEIRWQDWLKEKYIL